jgi:hypothetical protein
LTNEGRNIGDDSVFSHTAVIVPVGDSRYNKGIFAVICSVRRIGGGNPEGRKEADDLTVVIVRDGIGKLEVYGGDRGKRDNWEPERIEVRPISVVVGIPIDGTPVREQ